MSRYRTLALAAIALPAIAFPLIASAVNTPPELAAPKESCSGIQWSPEFLTKYPKAPVACREVTVKDGIKYAKFEGKVSKVGHHFVETEVSNVAGTPVSTIAFEIGVGGKVTMDDKIQKVKDLKVGDELTFWVREGQFGISPTLADRPMSVMKPTALTN